MEEQIINYTKHPVRILERRTNRIKQVFEPWREDLLVPIEQVRDKNGRVYGCYKLTYKFVEESESYYLQTT
jgi:hypothetical protein